MNQVTMSDAEDTVDIDQWPVEVIVKVIEALDSELQRRYDERSGSGDDGRRRYH